VVVEQVRELAVAGRIIGDGNPCYVIAEACINHNGNFELALAMADAALQAGADAVKYQVHYLHDEMLRNVPTSGNFDKPLWDALEETNLTNEQHVALQRHCDEIGIQYLCTAYCREAADFLASIGVPLLKFGSGETTNLPYLGSVARHGIPMLVSTGMAMLDEIDATVSALRAAGTPFGITHCTSEYPPVYEDINLGLIPLYKERYGIVVGHSDHTPTIYTALAAVALGASVIEKHFTLDRAQPGGDQAVSLEPDEFAEMVRGIRAIEAASGTEKRVFAREQAIRAWAHHSVVTLRPVRAGEMFTDENVWVKRPGTGIPAAQLDEIIGREATRDVPADALLEWMDVA
jgi:N-acetylneuraminate synthase